MFTFLFYIISCSNHVFGSFPLFKVATVRRHETILFRRSGEPYCSNYVKQNDLSPLLFLDENRTWQISSGFTTLENQNYPTCNIIESWSVLQFSNLNSLELCNSTIGYEIDEGTPSLILDGDNGKNKLKELVETSTEDEHVQPNVQEGILYVIVHMRKMSK